MSMDKGAPSINWWTASLSDVLNSANGRLDVYERRDLELMIQILAAECKRMRRKYETTSID